MIQRCTNPNHQNHSSYGGRGITICEEWFDFCNFYRDMGDKPTQKHSIDRIDNNKGYYKENCRWATKSEQQNNRRDTVYLTLKGETKPVTIWSKELGVSATTLLGRVRNKWSEERILTEGKSLGKIFITFNGKTQNLTDWSRELNINSETMRDRYNSGWSNEKMLTTPVRKKAGVTFNGKTQSLRAWARELKVSPTTFRKRYESGWSVEKMLTTPVEKRN